MMIQDMTLGTDVPSSPAVASLRSSLATVGSSLGTGGGCGKLVEFGCLFLKKNESFLVALARRGWRQDPCCVSAAAVTGCCCHWFLLPTTASLVAFLDGSNDYSFTYIESGGAPWMVTWMHVGV